jgi:hypothetical protein
MRSYIRRGSKAIAVWFASGLLFAPAGCVADANKGEPSAYSTATQDGGTTAWTLEGVPDAAPPVSSGAAGARTDPLQDAGVAAQNFTLKGKTSQ